VSDLLAPYQPVARRPCASPLAARVLPGHLGANTEEILGSIFFNLLLLALAVGLVVVIGLFLRRRLTREDFDSGGPGFSLAELRRMHREGKLTDAEFHHARTRMAGIDPVAPDGKAPDGKAPADGAEPGNPGGAPEDEEPPPDDPDDPDASAGPGASPGGPRLQ